MTQLMPIPRSSKLEGLPDPVRRASRTAALREAANSVATPTRSPSSLAAAAQQVLHSLTGKRVPRLGSLRERLQQSEATWSPAELDRALHALQEASAAVDFLPPRGGAFPLAEFHRQCAAVGAAARRLATTALHFIGRHAVDASTTRMLWAELLMESRSIHKRVRHGLAWLRNMEQELALRRQAATAPVSRQALQELARRGEALQDKLHAVEDFCGAARAARSLGTQVLDHRAALCRLLQDEVRPAGLTLQHQLQAMQEVAEARPPEPAELLAAIEARHALEVAVTRAVAELHHLEALQAELDTQLAWMQQKAKPLAEARSPGS
ncbi:hypothetical protein GCM10028796_33570 [Ramlibacter monticola]|uniref:Uncharacterized protein n=1 Tax=Ramlibacter monticola TaxID=1926872 RepID=A0A936Z317_9BURK|nr:hypothetical protein [Ramlibacter monticola]MBL0394070.1 hypothetical protein [Ramlibacter monticola]